jgi:hypothetical protein
MSMALLDRVVWLDPESMRVRCCGCCCSWFGTEHGYPERSFTLDQHLI